MACSPTLPVTKCYDKSAHGSSVSLVEFTHNGNRFDMGLTGQRSSMASTWREPYSWRSACRRFLTFACACLFNFCFPPSCIQVLTLSESIPCLAMGSILFWTHLVSYGWASGEALICNCYCRRNHSINSFWKLHISLTGYVRGPSVIRNSSNIDPWYYISIPEHQRWKQTSVIVVVVLCAL